MRVMSVNIAFAVFPNGPLYHHQSAWPPTNGSTLITVIVGGDIKHIAPIGGNAEIGKECPHVSWGIDTRGLCCARIVSEQLSITAAGHHHYPHNLGVANHERPRLNNIP